MAGSAAALTDLLFIGLSLNLRIIIKTPEHTARARETFGGLLSLLVLSILLLIPGQVAAFSVMNCLQGVSLWHSSL